jgi:PH (Pleckstrin Homology) domain-containing protein
MVESCEALIERLRGELDLNERLSMKRTLRRLPELLGPGEQYGCLTKGRYNGRFGIIAATDRRLMFISDGIFVGQRATDFPYETIDSVETGRRMGYGVLKLHADGSTALVNQIHPRDNAAQVAEYMRDRVTAA